MSIKRISEIKKYGHILAQQRLDKILASGQEILQKIQERRKLDSKSIASVSKLEESKMKDGPELAGIRKQIGDSASYEEVFVRLEEFARSSPIRLYLNGFIWCYDGFVFDVEELPSVESFSTEEIALLVREFRQEEKKKFNRLRRKHAPLPDLSDMPGDVDSNCAGKGYVYVLINATMPGFVKIAYSTKLPEDRAAELSNVTGVAAPFLVVWEERLEQFVEAERLIHAQLDAMRHSENREFFQMDTRDAIRVVIDVAKTLRNDENET